MLTLLGGDVVICNLHVAKMQPINDKILCRQFLLQIIIAVIDWLLQPYLDVSRAVMERLEPEGATRGLQAGFCYIAQSPHKQRLPSSCLSSVLCWTN